MRPSQHVAISGIITIGFFAVTKSWVGSLACFLSGIFIDLDHVLDFWIAKKKFLFSYEELYAYFAQERQGKLYLLLHSYELLALFWLAIYFLHLDVLWLGVAWGLTTHMIADQITNPLRAFGYFLVYRIKHGFAKESLFRREFYQQLV
jgi:hypothetical protein